MSIMRRHGGFSRAHHPLIDVHPLSTRLFRTRRAAKLTQPQLATLLGVNKKTIESLEAGRVPPIKSTRMLIEMWILRNEMNREELEF